MKQVLRKLSALALVSLFAVPVCFAQDRAVFGTVFEQIDNEKQPLVGAIVKVDGTALGTQTDGDGTFRLQVPESAKRIIISHMSYLADTIELTEGANSIATVLRPLKQLNQVNVTYRKKGNEVSLLDPIKKEQISEDEFLKAACCNLSESFETTPSVDVAFTDAVSGYKQIQMLGLSGPYTLITRENIPDTRGLASITGLTFTPGTWLQGVQLSKGTGSVVNGYEGLAGQINVELRKPFTEKAEKWNINLYQNIQGRSEANVIYQHKFNDKLSTNAFVHASGRWRKNDMNNDGFMDQPLNRTFIGLNRWFYFDPSGWEFQFGAKGSYLEQTGGQLDFERGTEQVSGKPWGYQMNIRRYEGFAKIGHIFKEKKGTSMGLQLSAVNHQQDAIYGKRDYSAEQTSLYANLIYQTILGNTNHILKLGASNLVDNYTEQFENRQFRRSEVVPGAFAEYTYNHLENFNVVAGLRGDYHNIFGAFVTPRLHMRYAPFEKTAIRASVGRAQRTANILAENMGYMASGRSFLFLGSDPLRPYGMNPEVAWNYGLNLTQKFRLNYRDGSVSADYYYTQFDNQVVVDVEDARYVRFYNLDGRSFANSFQIQADYEPIRMLDVRLAYRWYDVQTNYSGDEKLRPLVARHRAFANIGYETRSKYRFDYTVQWIGQKRVPSVYDNSNGNIVSESYSPSFFLMNAQVSKAWNGMEVYVGGENLMNFLQDQPIIGADAPHDKGFDASMIWGPVVGRNIYAGLRWKIK